jgi:SAM-dependent methyltransferase
MTTDALPERAIWHDAECGGYGADLPLWRALAERCGGRVLDVGAGTGRVSLDLARRGHAVTALDRDPELLGVLRERARGLPVDTVEADARDFRLDAEFALCLVPMQTIQLLGGAEARRRFLACARAHLSPGARLAAAIAEDLPGFEPGDGRPLPVPDVREHAGWVYCSRPIATRHRGSRIVLERRRETVAPDGTLTAGDDVVELDRLEAGELEAEARAAGFAVEPRISIAPTDDHVGSEVVVVRAAP